MVIINKPSVSEKKKKEKKKDVIWTEQTAEQQDIWEKFKQTVLFLKRDILHFKIYLRWYIT